MANYDEYGADEIYDEFSEFEQGVYDDAEPDFDVLDFDDEDVYDAFDPDDIVEQGTEQNMQDNVQEQSNVHKVVTTSGVDTSLSELKVVYFKTTKLNAIIVNYGLVLDENNIYVPDEGVIPRGVAQITNSYPEGIDVMLYKMYRSSKQRAAKQAEIDVVEAQLTGLQREYQEVDVAYSAVMREYKSMVDTESAKENMRQALATQTKLI